MKVFLDSNIWISAFIARGLCTDLVEHLLSGDGGHECWISREVTEEVGRILEAKFSLSDSARQRAARLLAIPRRASSGHWSAPADFPDPDDIPIVAAAIQAGVDIFVTGDQALLALGCVEKMPIVSPRIAFQRVRGLA